jgi:DNA-binding NarL/FixJ family response regulator
VIVTDIVMPGPDGIAATVTLCARRPGTRVVLVTVHDDLELAELGYAAGALAFVSKHRAGDELVPAVRAALRGERYVSTSTDRRLGSAVRVAERPLAIQDTTTMRPGGSEHGSQ